jgi:hypothetical protein
MRCFILYLAVAAIVMSGTAFSAEEPVKKAEAVAEAAEKPAEGTLFRAIGGEWLTRKAGIKMDNVLQIGFSRNSVSDAGARQGGTSNFPIGYPGDENFQFHSIDNFFHRDIKSNIIPRITPIPGPVPKDVDVGFMFETVYGRNGQPCRVYGYDMHWGLNEPGASNPPLAASSKQYFLCTPNVFAQIYLPLFKGVAITGGRFGSGIGYEIPPAVRPSPDFFYSRTYAFYAQPDEVVGFLVSANLYRSPKHGFLAAEFGANQGWQTLDSPNGGTLNNFMGAVRWRSAKMTTWIDYTFIVGPAQVKAPAFVSGSVNLAAFNYFPLYHVVSPRSQSKFYTSLHGSHDFNAKWRMTAELLYGKQSGDGKADTYVISGPAPAPDSLVPNFKGATWNGFNGQLLYTVRKGLQTGMRFERFHNPDGFALYPLTFNPPGTALGNVVPVMNGARGNLHDITFGVRYDLTKYMMLRPELRADWQTRNNGVNVFGTSNTVAKSSSHQVTGSIDLVLYF